MTNTQTKSDIQKHRNDNQILRLRMVLGLPGYAVYTMLSEKLDEEGGTLAADYYALAFDFHADAQLVKQVAEDFALFALSPDGKTIQSIDDETNQSIGDETIQSIGDETIQTTDSDYSSNSAATTTTVATPAAKQTATAATTTTLSKQNNLANSPSNPDKRKEENKETEILPLHPHKEKENKKETENNNNKEEKKGENRKNDKQADNPRFHDKPTTANQPEQTTNKENCATTPSAPPTPTANNETLIPATAATEWGYKPPRKLTEQEIDDFCRNFCEYWNRMIQANNSRLRPIFVVDKTRRQRLASLRQNFTTLQIAYFVGRAVRSPFLNARKGNLTKPADLNWMLSSEERIVKIIEGNM